MVRYADGPTTEATCTVAASPAEIWPAVTDIELPARFSEEFQGARWLDGATGPARGARFEGRNRNEAIGEWTVTCTVTDFEPARVYEWTVGDVDAPAAVWRFEIEPTAEGCVLTERARLGPGPSGLVAYIERHPEAEEQIVAGRLDGLRANMQRTIEGIRDLVA